MLVALWWAGLFIAVAAAAPAVVPALAALTLGDCLGEAARRQPDIAAAREAVHKAQFQYRAVVADFLPQLSASAGTSRSGSEAAAGYQVGSDNSVGLRAEQSLFTGGRDTARLAQSRAALRVAEEQLRAIRAQISSDVKTAFARLLSAQELMELSGVIAKRRELNVSLVDLRYEGGREHQGSLLRMQALRQQAVADEVAARRALAVGRRRLAAALGWREPGQLAIRGTLTAGQPEGQPDFSTLALQTPNYRVAVAQEEAARAGVKLARSAYYPALSAQGAVNRAGDTWPPEQDSWSVGVQLSYPFFPGGRHVHDVHAAQAEQRRSAALCQSQDQQAAVLLEQSFADWQDAVESQRVQEDFVKAAQLRAEVGRSQYGTGLLSFDNWDLIENDLITQQKALLSARRDAVLAEAAWEKAQGVTLLPEK
ncbi:MAG: TolC family protein [Kiritimatiellaeota bacterium]|nr:TolC family protein [Kiritimatiellota bacterium]